MASTHVVVDGSNIATEGRSAPSLAQLDEAVRAFLDEHPHDKVTVVVDATFAHRIDKKERAKFEEAVLAGEIVTPPAGTVGRGDAFVLQIADKADAVVLSNDSFQEFHGTYDWLFDQGRLYGGKPVEHVGWIFVPRTPVRGPVSRKSTKAKKDAARAEATRTAGSTEPASKTASRAPKKEPSKGSAKGSSKGSSKAPSPAPQKSTRAGSGAKAGDAASPPAKSSSRTEPLNAPLTFINFVASHPIGSEVNGTVDRFSSHGAYVEVDGAQCYVPLKAMSDPPPRRARDVLTLGESRTFVVQSFDTPRRGIDLALPGAGSPAPAEGKAGASDATAAPEQDGDHRASNVPAGTRTRTRRTTQVATKKSAAKKAPAKKAPAKKAPAKKAPAKKAPAKKK